SAILSLRRTSCLPWHELTGLQCQQPIRIRLGQVTICPCLIALVRFDLFLVVASDSQQGHYTLEAF
ncbi:hypothetical protein AB3332_22240, partial [Ralstonia solanacearum]|uniref:hypothetical protein n=1 Tax=Ralstonia solanacearum TaxID=305 RepID=UPI0034DD35FC